MLNPATRINCGPTNDVLPGITSATVTLGMTLSCGAVGGCMINASATKLVTYTRIFYNSDQSAPAPTGAQFALYSGYYTNLICLGAEYYATGLASPTYLTIENNALSYDSTASTPPEEPFSVSPTGCLCPIPGDSLMVVDNKMAWNVALYWNPSTNKYSFSASCSGSAGNDCLPSGSGGITCSRDDDFSSSEFDLSDLAGTHTFTSSGSGWTTTLTVSFS
jgi:hypothetical protein